MACNNTGNAPLFTCHSPEGMVGIHPLPKAFTLAALECCYHNYRSVCGVTGTGGIGSHPTLRQHPPPPCDRRLMRFGRVPHRFLQNRHCCFSTPQGMIRVRSWRKWHVLLRGPPGAPVGCATRLGAAPVAYKEPCYNTAVMMTVHICIREVVEKGYTPAFFSQTGR